MYGYEEQEFLSVLEEEIEDMLSGCGYDFEEQLINIAMLAGVEEENERNSDM